MESKFSNVMVNQSSSANTGERVYMKAKESFPINVPKEYRIVDAHSARQLFSGGMPQCRSFDGKIGRSAETDWKEDIDCSQCPKQKEKDRDKKCQYKFVLNLEHEEEGKVYVLTTGYGAQLAFTDYVKELITEGLDADRVMTKITRIENPNGPGTTYTFEKGEVISADEEGVTEAEQQAIDALKATLEKRGESADVEKAALILGAMQSYGISDARATELAEMLAGDDGMITV